MHKADFIKAVQKKQRDPKLQDTLIDTCLQTPDLVYVLLEEMLGTHENASYFARILEMTVKTQPVIIVNYLAEFTQVLPLVKDDTTTRSCAKICEIIMIQYELKKDSRFLTALLPEHRELMINACFDWKINDRAVAIQVHAMYSLYLLGFTYAWIHPSVVMLIEKNIPHGSTGYQNRGRKVIKAIETKKLYKL